MRLYGGSIGAGVTDAMYGLQNARIRNLDYMNMVDARRRALSEERARAILYQQLASGSLNAQPALPPPGQSLTAPPTVAPAPAPGTPSVPMYTPGTGMPPFAAPALPAPASAPGAAPPSLPPYRSLNDIAASGSPPPAPSASSMAPTGAPTSRISNPIDQYQHLAKVLKDQGISDEDAANVLNQAMPIFASQEKQELAQVKQELALSKMLNQFAFQNRGLDIREAGQKSTADWREFQKNQAKLLDGTFDQKTLDWWADQVLAGGPMPSFGMGKSATTARALFMKTVQRRATETGQTPEDVIGAGIDVKASTSAMRNLSTYVARVNGSIRKADLSLNLVRETAKKGVAQGGSQFINKWIQAGRLNATDKSGADVVAFNSALQTFINEYARVMAGPASNAMLAEGARTEAQEMLNTKMTMDQIEASLGVMRKDMQYALQAQSQELESLRQQVRQPRSGGQPITKSSASDGTPTPKPDATRRVDVLKKYGVYDGD